MKTIRLSKSCIGIEEKEAVLRVLDAEFLGMGQDVQDFENELADFIGVPAANVVCVNTGTSALQLALAGLDIGLGDEVIVPSLTYVASFQAISATGATPVACEVDKNTLCIDIADVESKITSKTKAIMPVHYAGETAFIPTLMKLAEKHSLRVIEDAAHSFGGFRNGERIGKVGDVVCFSFDGIKNITSGEGGAIVTSDAALLERVKDGRLLGVEKDTEKRYKGERSWGFDVSHQGFRFHMSNIMAAIGREQLKKVDKFLQIRKQSVSQYVELLANVQGIECLEHNFSQNAPHIFVVKVVDGKRDYLLDALRERNIQCGLHYQPNHKLAYFKQKGCFEVVEQVSNEIITLPLHADLSSDDVSYVVDVIKELMGEKYA
ncbi:MAG: DegT/DnrJ/EryC1/StrS family aminotransferase [Flavobacteriales bacterium]|nr:DegT/DnrJ/EryC1/StrS family aminotransferase [Flavobacteriales bacterium]